MGAGLVRIDLHLHRYPSGYDAKRFVHRQYAGGIKHARHEHRGYNHGILRGSGGNGGILSDYSEDIRSLLYKILIVSIIGKTKSTVFQNEKFKKKMSFEHRLCDV